ncbi:hypothetical protein JST97_14145 [bacterium]|nr:hypothetical protein [bacterium]
MIKHPAQHFFLEQLVDYAGTFPPAGLPLSQALANYRSYQRGLAPSMLGRFICTGPALAELVALLHPEDGFLISVLLSSPEQVSLVQEFHARVNKSIRVDTVETAWSERASEWPKAWTYRLFFEVSPEQATEGARLCAPQSARLGLKLRTGSIKPEAIPSAQSLLTFLDAAHRARVGYKFTAGLHHARAGLYPLTYEVDAPRAGCFGFTSLFGLACLHWHGRVSPERLVEGLNCPDAPLLNESGLSWGDSHCSVEEIAAYRRDGGRSFGSCSFEEPLQELTEMGWIC